MDRNENDIIVTAGMAVAGVSELIDFDPEDGHLKEAAIRIYRAMEQTRIDLTRNLEGLRELEQSGQR